MANLAGLRPEVRAALQAATESFRQAGIPWSISPRGAFRTPADQQALYANRANNPYPVAPPGTSPHEQGLAVDLTFPGASLAQLAQAHTILGQAGFAHPNPAQDPPHFVFGGKAGAGRPWWDTAHGPAPPVLPAADGSTPLGGAPPADAGPPLQSTAAQTSAGLRALIDRVAGYAPGAGATSDAAGTAPETLSARIDRIGYGDGGTAGGGPAGPEAGAPESLAARIDRIGYGVRN